MLIILLLFAATLSSAQIGPSEMTSFDYPLLGLQAVISGEVRLRANLSVDGGVENVEGLSGHRLLVDAAAKAISQWKFVPYCHTNIQERAVDIVVDFRLEGEPRYRPKTTFRYHYPNRIVVSSSPAQTHIQYSNGGAGPSERP
jgi:TonB family protein